MANLIFIYHGACYRIMFTCLKYQHTFYYERNDF